MRLDTDVRQLVGKKKTVYPTKRSMNLYFKVDRTTGVATIALYVLFAAAVLLALAKFAIYDPWNRVRQMESQLLAMEERTAEQMLALKDYNQVLEDYIRTVPTQREQGNADVMDLLALIDTAIRPTAQVSQVSIEDNQVVVSFSGVTLAQAADLVLRLEQSPLVAETQVDTAFSTQNSDQVEVHVYFRTVQEGAGS